MRVRNGCRGGAFGGMFGHNDRCWMRRGDCKRPRKRSYCAVGDTEALASAIERLVSGEVKLTQQIPNLPTKEEYLARYLKSWESALL